LTETKDRMVFKLSQEVRAQEG